MEYLVLNNKGLLSLCFTSASVAYWFAETSTTPEITYWVQARTVS